MIRIKYQHKSSSIELITTLIFNYDKNGVVRFTPAKKSTISLYQDICLLSYITTLPTSKGSCLFTEPETDFRRQMTC